VAKDQEMNLALEVGRRSLEKTKNYLSLQKHIADHYLDHAETCVNCSKKPEAVNAIRKLRNTASAAEEALNTFTSVEADTLKELKEVAKNQAH